MENTAEETELKTLLEEIVPSTQFTIQLEAMDSQTRPFTITEPEFMRRMKEMQQSGGGMFGMGNMPDMYNLVANTNHDFFTQLLQTKTKKKRERLVNQAVDLAKLSKNLLQGEALTQFIARSYELIK